MTQSFDKDVAVGVTRAPCRVELEPDATPFVRWIGARLRAAIQTGRRPAPTGNVLVRSTRDEQSATIEVDSSGLILVTHGSATADETLQVDTENDLLPVGNGETSDRTRTLSELLAPNPTNWREAATVFWRANAGRPGMPSTIRLTATGQNGGDLVLGDGEPAVGIAGAPETLRRVLTGSTQLDDAIRRGEVSFHGTFPQLSVMVGAGWKVRMHD